jgi:heptosyltransferase-1
MPRILFVKTSSFGDVVHNCPAVSDAARKLPGAEIDWVVEQAFAGIAAMHAAVARVIPVAMRRWRTAPWNPAVWSEIGAFRRRLRAERYDAVIDTQSLLKSALISAQSRGTRHGMDRASAREPLAARFYDIRHAVPRELHAVERNRRLSAASLGYTVDASVDYGLRAAADTPSKDDAPYVVLLTMTSRTEKLWPEPSWIELGRALAARVVLPWGSETERHRAERIAAAIGSAAVPPRLQLEQLTGLFLKASRVVGVDTGLTHLAAALGAPTLGIYCGSDPAFTGLYGAARAKNVGTNGRPPQAAEVLQSLS